METKTSIVLVLAGTLALGTAGPSTAASMPTNPTIMKAAAHGSVTDVRGRHYGWHSRGLVAGAIIGGLAFGAMAAATAPPYYYDYGYGPYATRYGYRPYGYYGYYGYRPYRYQPYGYYGYRPYGFAAPYWHRGWSYRWHRYPWR
jgi:hypothetical protein